MFFEIPVFRVEGIRAFWGPTSAPPARVRVRRSSIISTRQMAKPHALFTSLGGAESPSLGPVCGFADEKCDAAAPTHAEQGSAPAPISTNAAKLGRSFGSETTDSSDPTAPFPLQGAVLLPKRLHRFSQQRRSGFGPGCVARLAGGAFGAHRSRGLWKNAFGSRMGGAVTGCDRRPR